MIERDADESVPFEREGYSENDRTEPDLTVLEDAADRSLAALDSDGAVEGRFLMAALFPVTAPSDRFSIVRPRWELRSVVDRGVPVVCPWEGETRAVLPPLCAPLLRTEPAVASPRLPSTLPSRRLPDSR